MSTKVKPSLWMLLNEDDLTMERARKEVDAEEADKWHELDMFTMSNIRDIDEEDRTLKHDDDDDDWLDDWFDPIDLDDISEEEGIYDD